MVKRVRDPLSPFAASPSLWPSLPPGPPIARSGRRRVHSLFLNPSPSPFSRTRRGRGREDTPSCRLARTARREAAGKRLSSLDVTGLLHCGFTGGLGFRERLVDGHRSGKSGREVLPDVSRDALELWDRHELNSCAASAFFVPAGIPSAHDHSQLPRLPRPSSGASA